MKRIISIVMLLFFVTLLLCSCSKGTYDKKMKTIGIVQIVEHPSLNTIRETIVKSLDKKGFKEGINITIDYQNAQGDQTNLKNISQKFVGNKYDLIIAISTPATQVVAAETSEIPIVFSGVTDPISAGLVENLDKPNRNITGTSDMVSVEKNMELAKSITPNIKTVGFLYNSGETSSQAVIKELRKYAKSNNLNLVEGAVTNTSEVQQVTESLVSKVDAIFATTDNTIASSMPVVSQIVIKAKKPMYTSADSMVKSGGLAGCGINYTVLGEETADMVVEVLNGKKPGEIPVRIMKDMSVYINKNTADKIGVTIPDSILKSAAEIFTK